MVPAHDAVEWYAAAELDCVLGRVYYASMAAAGEYNESFAFEVACEEALIGDEFVREPVFLFWVVADCVPEAGLVGGDSWNLARDEEEIVEYGVRFVMFL
jgi:hypothetical protein